MVDAQRPQITDLAELKDLDESGRFKIVSRLGSGGFGDVFEAIDRERDSHVALKTLRTPSAEMIRSLKREFRTVQDLHHPNLVRLGELFEQGGRWFFTMEFVQGVDILQYVAAVDRMSGPPPADRKEAPVAERRFVEWKLREALLQLSRGLHALHSAGKVHRDVKPANVLVTREGRVVIVDFGVMFDTHDGARAEAGILIGTPRYMAPEQAAADEVGPPADWYGVGGILFQALTGRSPFQGTTANILELKLTTEAPAPSELAPNLPKDLEQLCVDLLRMDPHARPTGPEILKRLAEDGAPAESVSAPRSGVFVGRKRELAALAEARETMSKGGAVTVIVRGESGVGKSALIRTFVDRLVAGSKEQVVVLRGRCYEREAVPFKGVDGIIDSLSQFLVECGGHIADKVLPDDFGILCRAFPVLTDVSEQSTAIPESQQILNPNELRSRLFAAVRELLGRVAKRWPLILVVDDLQWTDSDSLALLLDVLRPPTAPRLLFIASMRVGTGTGGGGKTVDDQIARIEGDVRHLEVDKLPRADAEALVTSLLSGSNAAEDTIQSIATEAGGHPLYIDELVRQRSILDGKPGILRLDDALWERVSRLDTEARRLLEVIVVAGAPIQQLRAARAAGIDAATVFAAASTLRNAHMIASGGVRSGDHLEAYHDRVRESVLAHLDEKSRQGIHARIAVAEEQAPTPDAEALATHWEGAGNLARAAQYAVAAGDRASAVLAFARAAAWYRKAIELGTADGKPAAVIRGKLAEALTSDGHEAEAAEVRLQVAERAEALEALNLRRQAAEQFLVSGRFERGQALLRAVLADVAERFPRSPLSLLFWLLVARVRVTLRGLAFQAAAPSALRPDVLARVDALASAGRGYAMTDNIRGAYFQSRSLLLSLDVGDTPRIARAVAYETMFTAAGGSAKRERTHALLDTAKLLAARVGTQSALAHMDVAAGYTSYMYGDLKAAKAAWTAAEERYRDKCVNVNFELTSMRTLLYRTLVLRGEFRELAERLPPVLRAATHRGDEYAVLNWRGIPMTMLYLAGDEGAVAAENIGELFHKLPKGVFHFQHFWTLMAAIEIDLYTGEHLRALERMRSHARAVKRSLLLRVEVLRVAVFEQRGRAAAGAAAAATTPAPELVASVAADAAGLGRIPTPVARGLGGVLRAAGRALAGDREGTLAELALAGEGFAVAEMFVHGAAVRRRQGQLMGGAEGAARVAEAETTMEKLGVQNTEAMTRLVVPAVERLLAGA